MTGIRKIKDLAVAALLLALSAVGVRGAGEECFMVAAGRDVTADGSVIMAHNEDNGFDRVFRLRRVERAVHPPGSRAGLAGGGSIARADTTWEYLIFEMPGMPFSHGLLNEHGVAVVSNNCPSREDRPRLVDGGIGPRLRYLVAERSRTAREGVRLVGGLVERFGYSESGRTLTIADSREVWQVAMVNGTIWAAARVPDDMVAALANVYNIHGLDLADTLNFLGSERVVSYARERGWYDPATDGAFDFQRAYSEPGRVGHPYQRLRVWSAYRHLVSGGLPSPESDQPMPFALRPDRPLGPADFFRVLRDHYEHTRFVAGGSGPHRPASETGTRPICAGSTNHGDVFQLRSGMPAAVGALWWHAWWRPCSAPFLPLYYGVARVPEALTCEVPSSAWEDPSTARMPGPETALGLFHGLDDWVDSGYGARIGGVRAAWLQHEAASLAMQRGLEEQALREWDSSRREAVAELLARYCAGAVEDAMRTARELMRDE